MSSLKRTKQGEFKIEDSYTLEQIKNKKYKLLEMQEVLKEYLQIEANEYIENKIKNGCLLENRYNEDIIVFINKNQQVIGIYKKYEKDMNKIKPWKVFN